MQARELPAGGAGRRDHSGEVSMTAVSSSLQELLHAHKVVGTLPQFWKHPFAIRKDFHPRALRAYLPRVFTAIAFYSVFMFLDCISQAVLEFQSGDYYKKRWEARPPYHDGHVVLWDLGHSLLPPLDTKKYWWLSPDSLVSLGPAAIVARFYIIPGPLSLRWTIMGRMFMLSGFLFGLRGVTIISTVLPNPDANCVPKITYPDKVIKTAIEIFMHRNVTCHDVLYSGHTTIITLTVLFVLKYTAQAPWWLPTTSGGRKFCVTHLRIIQLLCLVYWTVGIYSIIASRFHYTVDCLIAIVMTYFAFSWYHKAIEMAPFRNRRWFSIYSFLVWFTKHDVDLKVAHADLQKKAERMKEVEETMARQILEEHTPAEIIAAGSSWRFFEPADLERGGPRDPRRESASAPATFDTHA